MIGIKIGMKTLGTLQSVHQDVRKVKVLTLNMYGVKVIL